MSLVLLVAPDPVAAALEVALASHGVATVTAADAATATRLAATNQPAIVVFDATAAVDPAALVLLEDPSSLVVVLARGERDAAVEWPERVRTLDPEMGPEQQAERLAFAAGGLEVGIQPDPELASLVGDLSSNPVLEVVRVLCRRRLRAEIELDGGTIVVGDGDVLAARSRRAHAIKAFCRLARRRTGMVRVRPSASAAREIGMELEQLLLRALEDAQEAPPDLRATPKPLQPGLHQAKGLLDYQRELLLAVEESATVADLLDALPWPDGLVAKRLGRMVEVGLVLIEQPRRATAVFTDSTADLAGRTTRQLGIAVVPLMVYFGSQSFRDGIDIRPSDFYDLLTKRSEHPRTQPPDVDTFAVQFAQRLTEQDVVSIQVSGKLSLTVQNAIEGARQALESRPRPGAVVEVVDGGSVSAGTGWLAIAAARMAERGLAAAEIAAHLRVMAPRIQTLFVVDTLDYLVRGGRLGKAQGFVGKLLGIKPILGVVDGAIAAVDKVRGGRHAHPRIVELLAQRLDRNRPVVAIVAHAKAPVWADRLRDLLAKTFEVRESLITEMGPVVGTHAGPGCVGAAVFQPTDEEWALVEPLPAELVDDAV